MCLLYANIRPSLQVGDLDSVRRTLEAVSDRMGDGDGDDEQSNGVGPDTHRDSFLVCLIARAKLVILEHAQPNAASLPIAPSACIGAVADCWQVREQ
jgi:hypothetical protein